MKGIGSKGGIFFPSQVIVKDSLSKLWGESVNELSFDVIIYCGKY